jgi:chitinase
MPQFRTAIGAISMSIFATVFAAILTLPIAFDASAAQTYKIVAYYFPPPEGRPAQTPADIDGRLVTHINYAFANILGGEVVAGNGDADTGPDGNFAKLRALRKAHPHLKTLISVGGWTWSKDFSDVAATEASRAKFADSAVAFIRKHGFDGVDIDWESPVAGGAEGNIHRPEDKQNFTLLLLALRMRLDAAGGKDRRHYLLTIAAGNNDAFIANTEMRKIAKIVDWTNVMTYDFNGPWSKYAGHNAPLHDDPSIARADSNPRFNVASVVDMMLQADVPPRKLVLGMPFYGYSWKGCGVANNGQHQGCAGKGRGSAEEGALDFTEIDETLVNRQGFVRHWNDAAKVPFLFKTDTGEFISYDDTESFDWKIRWLKQKHLGGAMFWHIGADRKAVLQKKLARELLNRQP